MTLSHTILDPYLPLGECHLLQVQCFPFMYSVSLCSLSCSIFFYHSLAYFSQFFSQVHFLLILQCVTLFLLGITYLNSPLYCLFLPSSATLVSLFTSTPLTTMSNVYFLSQWFLPIWSSPTFFINPLHGYSLEIMNQCMTLSFTSSSIGVIPLTFL